MKQRVEENTIKRFKMWNVKQHCETESSPEGRNRIRRLFPAF